MAKATQFDMREVNAGLKELRSQTPRVEERSLDLTSEGLNSEAQMDSPVLHGDLKASHVVDRSIRRVRRIGATVIYAAAVHARHPTKAGWYLNAIVKNAAKFMQAALAKALAEAHGGGGSGGGGGA